jgi:hypothetical protein
MTHAGKIKLTALLVSGLFSFECQHETRETAQAAEDSRKREDEDRLFQKRLECGKLLARAEGSALGPQLHAERGILPLGPVAFFSPKLNTCVYVYSSFLQGQTVKPPIHKYETEVFSDEDLLTGRSLEDVRQFDMNVPEEAKAARSYEDEVIRKYGGQVP